MSVFVSEASAGGSLPVAAFQVAFRPFFATVAASRAATRENSPHTLELSAFSRVSFAMTPTLASGVVGVQCGRELARVPGAHQPVRRRVGRVVDGDLHSAR